MTTPRRWTERARRHVRPLDTTGTAVAVLLALVSLTPSLVPRTYLFQGLATGVSAALGYALGVVLGWIARRARRPGRVALPRRARRALLVLGLLATAVMLVLGARWQREVAAATGMAQTTTDGWLRVAPVALGAFALLLALGRLLRLESILVARGLRHRVHLRRGPAAVLAVTAVLMTTALLLDAVVARAALTTAERVFAERNDRPYPGVVAPSSPWRSGSPSSLAPWSTLGREGQDFVAGGLPPDRLAAASGRVPVEPIRVYVGLGTAAAARDRAALAVAELERTGAFDRDVLAVVTTTGTGWVDDPVADSLELLHGGDTALVATQYSDLPSWLSFLFDRGRAGEEGRALFDAVAARVEARAPERRPRLVSFGESLGSQGAEAPFASIAEARTRADGVLWAGPPNSNRLWSRQVAARDPGSPQVLPVVDDGRAIRFAATRADLASPPGPWSGPRVLWLQHATDPVVWWSPSLLWRPPPWLSEPRGRDVVDAMTWFPLVTFWQVTFDLTNAAGVPDGHGHNYRSIMLDAWAAVAPPAGWSPADTERVRGMLER